MEKVNLDKYKDAQASLPAVGSTWTMAAKIVRRVVHDYLINIPKSFKVSVYPALFRFTLPAHRLKRRMQVIGHKIFMTLTITLFTRLIREKSLLTSHIIYTVYLRQHSQVFFFKADTNHQAYMPHFLYKCIRRLPYLLSLLSINVSDYL